MDLSEARELVLGLPRLLGSARRVRIYDQRGPMAPPRKRRDWGESSLLADVTYVPAVAAFAEALRVRADTEFMDWMEHPGLWLVFDGADGRPLVRLGLLGTEWLRWGSRGDVQLASPDTLRSVLSAWVGPGGAQ
ncbi:hypothetical protein [Actinoplanes sp. NPDC048796]|uniref:hypothetical protein n=1 Tax=unclassified Actinoplanes TaxID=2626549 RepID=UPI0033DC1CEC